ncbi:hypothetical protein D3C81_1702930 [compost metagenome]
MAVYGEGREAIGDHDGQVDTARIGLGMLAQGRDRVVVQPSPQVGALQVLVAVVGGAVQHQAVTPTVIELGRKPGMVERQVHGIAGLGMGELEVQLRTSRQAGARAPQGDTRRCQGAQGQPGVVGGYCARVHGHPYASCANAWRKAGGRFSPKRTRPSAWVKMPVRASHASNSGPGFRPRVWRAYSASWNEVVW